MTLISVANGATVFASAADANTIPDDLAVITDNSRNPPQAVDDFLRLIYVPSSIPVTTLGTPSQKRSFFGDTRFYIPPISSVDIVGYAGGTVNDQADLVAMRCRPANQSMVAPQLAIWPNLAQFLQQDLPPVPCPAATVASTQAKAYCLAQQFQDTSNIPLIESLYNAVSFGRDLFEIPADSTGLTGAGLLSTTYGIGPGHSGLVSSSRTALAEGRPPRRLSNIQSSQNIC